MGLRKRIGNLVIILLVFIMSISVHYIWDMGKVQRVFNTFTKPFNTSQYIIDAVFDEDSMTVKAEQKIRYENVTDHSQKEIYFHLYANAFGSKETAPFEASEMTKAYPNGFDKGWIEINNIKEGNKKVNYKIMGIGNTNLRVTPKKPVEPGTTMELTIDFELKLPNCIGRMGYGDHTVNISNWYPILAVFDENGWNLDPYYAIGDPFYSDIGNYDVTLTIPEKYELATTGNILRIVNKNSSKTYKIQAEKVRDFAMVLSKDFSIDRATVDGIEVISYTIRGLKKEKALQYGQDAIEIFSRIFGKYPYSQLSIVASDFFIGGMEYPNLVMIGQFLYEMKEDLPLEYVIAHEVAHQWWYGIVGNNEVKEPWLDEALTEYSTLKYFKEKYGDHIEEQIFEKMIKGHYEDFARKYSKKEKSISRSLKDFDSALEYSSLVYSKGAMFIRELEEEMGEENFNRALREYYEAYQFRNATTKDFYNILQKNTDKDLKREFSKWLNIKME